MQFTQHCVCTGERQLAQHELPFSEMGQFAGAWIVPRSGDQLAVSFTDKWLARESAKGGELGVLLCLLEHLDGSWMGICPNPFVVLRVQAFPLDQSS